MFCCLNALPLQMQICLGMCPDVTEEDKKAKLRSIKIEQDLQEHAKAEKNIIRILLLGVAESGKSTLIKQIKIIHSQGFSKQELVTFKAAVFDNLLTSMKIVLQGMGILKINLANQKNKAHARSILCCSQCVGNDQELLPFIALALCCLWADQGVRAAATRGYEFDLNDSALYFFENISRIITPNYIPTDMDVLRVRLRTRGIIETEFQVNKKTFRVYDVGAQRSVRKKWLDYFDSIHAVVFVVSLSCYDMTCFENASLSRLQESLQLFSSVCTSIVFQNTTLILFMNKADLFQEKILKSGRHLRFYMSSYKGADGDVDAAAGHITDMFVACSKSNKPVYHHFTTATDTSHTREVFHAAMDQILEENLAAVQML